ncbi:hypothetical protein NDN01_04185 [Sphingomonas sp. QA11]|uniref:hypothetical protein n=1 Tax=Sphingomonas sp. QA11 TaxID=2950605 RepID=UPI002349FA35|nr:hypothetical protein [Sphingomonas sp. QA11]WCM28132.1 hypothetical protein NDN01_04185 [Sphingomonas sp. QA11]
MVAKGIDYYLYSDSEDLRIGLGVPNIPRSHGPEANFKRNNFQVQSSNIPDPFNYTGRLEWVTLYRGQDMIRHWQNISSLDGNLKTGTMHTMFKTPPRIGSPTVCWGLYDAGSGKVSGMTNQHQLYVYATRDQRRWMGDLAKRNPRVARGPFSRFALPGSHDAGMFDMRAVRKVLHNPAFVIALGAHMGVAAALLGPRAIANLAMTQKDDIRTQLDIGTRYFDFRPGWMHPAIRPFFGNTLYHQHGLVPGYPYVDFLVDVLRWLEANPGEIVVVNPNTQGFAADAMRPNDFFAREALTTAIARVKPPWRIDVGMSTDLDRSYDALIRDNTRLIFTNTIDNGSRFYNSWSGAYATLRPAPIIKAFEGMKRDMPANANHVVMQMQATATKIGAVVAASVVTTSDASSPLLATKAVMDAATNPWLREHAAKRLSPDHLLVFLNDFVDNCMVETAIQVTEQRARD